MSGLRIIVRAGTDGCGEGAWQWPQVPAGNRACSSKRVRRFHLIRGGGSILNAIPHLASGAACGVRRHDTERTEWFQVGMVEAGQPDFAPLTGRRDASRNVSAGNGGIRGTAGDLGLYWTDDGAITTKVGA